MRVDTKAFTGFYIIIIKSEQGAKSTAHGIAKITEAEKEITFQPAYVFNASIARREVLCFHNFKCLHTGSGPTKLNANFRIS